MVGLAKPRFVIEPRGEIFSKFSDLTRITPGAPLSKPEPATFYTPSPHATPTIPRCHPREPKSGLRVAAGEACGPASLVPRPITRQIVASFW